MTRGMNFALAAFVVLCFAATIEYLDLTTRVRAVARRSRQCLQILRDPSLDDRQKEEALQHQARQLFVLFAVLVGVNLLAIALPLAVVWLLGRMGVGTFHGTLATLGRADFLIGTTAVGIPTYLIVRRFRRR
ncbi:MAG: hypothetical protein R6V13_03210 [Anaerolineae bacterium]